MINVNQPAPDFELADLSGSLHRLKAMRGRLVLINFWSAECPWSEQADREIIAGWEAWGERITWWTIAANANEPLELLEQTAAARRLPLVLIDAKGEVAGLYDAQTTPNVFLVDAQGILRYHGAVNDRTFRQRTPAHFYLRDAVQALLEGRLPDIAETPPYGCTIVRFASG